MNIKKLMLLAAVAALLVMVSASSSMAAHLADGLIAYWPLDDDTSPTADASGHGHAGTVVGSGATFGGGNIAPIPGNVDAIDFDGGGTNGDPDYVSAVDAATLTPTGSAVTLSAWIYPEGIDLGDLHMVFGKWNDLSREYELMLQWGKMYFYAYDGVSYTAAISITTLGTGSWYHVAGVWDGTDLQVYINGSPDGASTAFAGPIGDSAAMLTIGAQRWNSTWWRFFDGVIDEARIYDRALDADDIASLYLTGDLGTLFVDDDGEVGLGSSLDCDGTGVFVYDVIQDAVDAAAEGDTILVCPEGPPFNESIVVSTDGLTLSGISGSMPVLDGGNAAIDAFTLTDGLDGLTIEGFEIRNYGADAFTQPGNAIQAWDMSTSNVTIRNNNMHDFSWNAVLVGSEGGYVHHNWMVKDNIVADAAFAGIELTNCEGCTIMKNDVDPTFLGIVVQARSTSTTGVGSHNVTIDGVSVLHNTVDAPILYGIYVLSFTGHPTAFTPITGASSLLSSVTISHNTVVDPTGFDTVPGRGIRFWAFNDAATAINGRIMKNEVFCLDTTPGSPGIQVLESGDLVSGQQGTVENVKVVNNTVHAECNPQYTDQGDATKFPPGLGPYFP